MGRGLSGPKIGSKRVAVLENRENISKGIKRAIWHRKQRAAAEQSVLRAKRDGAQRPSELGC